MPEYFLQAETFNELMIRAYQKEEEVWIGDWWKHLYDVIFVVHQDGSTFRIRHAFYKLALIEIAQIEVFLVYAEHNGIMSFAKNDLAHFSIIKNKNEGGLVLIDEEPGKQYFL